MVSIVVLFAAVVVVSPGDDGIVFCVVMEVDALQHEVAQSCFFCWCVVVLILLFFLLL